MSAAKISLKYLREIQKIRIKGQKLNFYIRKILKVPQIKLNERNLIKIINSQLLFLMSCTRSRDAD